MSACFGGRLSNKREDVCGVVSRRFYTGRMDKGQWLGGYRLIERRGVGGAGTVWLAEDEGGMRVALKLLHPAVAHDELSRERLVREMRTVNAVPSTGVAHVIDIEVDDVQPFIVSEYIDGPTLSEVLADEPLNSSEAIEYADAIRRIISRVHDAGVTHRDIKPGNIILSAVGPVLIDFGIAQAEDDLTLTATGFVSGTASYASPEVLRGQRADEYSDWWAWAATFLQMLTGRAPFGSGSTEAVMNRVLSGAPDTSGLPAPVARLFTLALHPDMSKRLAPHNLLEALKQPGVWEMPISERDAHATEFLPARSASAYPAPLTRGEQKVTLEETSLLQHGHEEGATRVLAEGSLGRTTAYPEVSSPGEELVSSLQGYTPEGVSSPVTYGAVPQAAFPYSVGGSGAVFNPTVLDHQPDRGFSTAPPSSTPFVTISVLAALALLPLFLGAPGFHALGGSFLLLGFIGGISRSVRRRRLAALGVRPSDWWVTFARSPLIVVQVIFAQALGLLVSAAVVGAIAYVGVSYLPYWARTSIYVEPQHIPLALYQSQSSPALVEVTANFYVALGMYAVVLLCVLLVWLLPSGRALNEGIAWPVRVFLPALWARAILTMMIVGAIAATWWFPVKSLVLFL